MAELNANLDELPDQESFEPLPAGRYHIEVAHSDAKMVDTAQGRRVEVEYRVVTGPYEGRKGWDRFDIDRVANTRDGPKLIDGGRFKRLCAAVGITGHVSDTAELHGIAFYANATIEPANGQYGPKNRWDGYKSASGQMPTQAAAPRQSSAPQPQARPAQNVTGKPISWRQNVAANGSR